MNTIPPIDFLAIGHVCHDWSSNGNLLGGTASYASIFAKKMELNVGVLTSFGNDFEFKTAFQDIHLSAISSNATTFFKNIYQENHRQQYLLKKANNIFTKHISQEFSNPKMVLLGPIANEIDLGILEKFQNSMIAICPQGWMRRSKKDGKIFHKMIDDWSIFKNAEIVFLSEEDLNFQLELIPELASLFKILVITKAEKGADVFFKNKQYSVPSFETKIVDPTGAGDIFATAFLIHYFEKNDPIQAAIFANSAAAFCIEGIGLNGIVSRKKIEDRIKI